MGTNTYGIDLSSQSIHVDDTKVRTAQDKDSKEDSKEDSKNDSNKDTEETCAKED
jgi:hypothetical protein